MRLKFAGPAVVSCGHAWGESEAAAIDLVGHNALENCLAGGRVQALQQVRKALSIMADDASDQLRLGDNDSGAFDRSPCVTVVVASIPR